jgi:quinol monooxygenase YgiN
VRTITAVLFGVSMMLAGVLRDTRAQAPGPVEAHLHAVTYVEVRPSSRADAVVLLTRYREATRTRDGNLRCEVVSRLGQPYQFVVLEVWRDATAFEAHGASTVAAQLREQLHAIRTAPLDARIHLGASVGPLQPPPGGDAVYVVTHVDVVPPRKDDGLAALRQLAVDSRDRAGNARFEVVQQTNRPNHFTVVEIWTDMRAVEAHTMAETTRRFRDALTPWSGSLYDERLFKAVD